MSDKSKELELLRKVAIKGLEMFDSDDLWIDGIWAGRVGNFGQ